MTITFEQIKKQDYRVCFNKNCLYTKKKSKMSRSKRRRNDELIELRSNRTLRLEYFQSILTNEEFSANIDSINTILDYGYISFFNNNLVGILYCTIVKTQERITFLDFLNRYPNRKNDILNQAMLQYVDSASNIEANSSSSSSSTSSTSTTTAAETKQVRFLYDPKLRDPNNPLVRRTLVTPQDIKQVESKSKRSTKRRKSNVNVNPDDTSQEYAKELDKALKKIFSQVNMFKKDCFYMTETSGANVRNYQSVLLKNGNLNIGQSPMSEVNIKNSVTELVKGLTQAINKVGQELKIPEIRLDINPRTTNLCCCVKIALDPNRRYFIKTNLLEEKFDAGDVEYSNEEDHPGIKINDFNGIKSLHPAIFGNGTFTIVGAKSLKVLLDTASELITTYIRPSLDSIPLVIKRTEEESKRILQMYPIDNISELKQPSTLAPSTLTPISTPTSILRPAPISIPRSATIAQQQQQQQQEIKSQASFRTSPGASPDINVGIGRVITPTAFDVDFNFNLETDQGSAPTSDWAFLEQELEQGLQQPQQQVSDEDNVQRLKDLLSGML